MDADTLIKENMGRLTLAARKLSRNFGVPDMTEDLIQEGSLALMEAAERYDTSGDTPFDIYSDRIIKPAMLDYIYRNATQFTMPPDRFRVLRIAMYHMMREDAVEKAKDAYPESRMKQCNDVREKIKTSH